jgi:hypothetical protein
MDVSTALRYRSLGSSWRCLHHRGLSCIWACLYYRGICCTGRCLHHRGLRCIWTCLLNTTYRRLYCSWKCPPQGPVLLLEVLFTPQGLSCIWMFLCYRRRVQPLEMSTPQRPERHLDVSKLEACAAPGGVYTTGVLAASGRVYTLLHFAFWTYQSALRCFYCFIDDISISLNKHGCFACRHCPAMLEALGMRN